MDRLTEIMRNSHKNNYIGENVSQLEHSILAAQEAESMYPSEIELIVASFLHDIGHQPLYDKQNIMCDDNGNNLGIIDHETIGSHFLKQMGFSEKVCSLVGNHVKAKRYLTYNNPKYSKNLSNASSQTLLLQGGSMKCIEAFEFEKDPYFRDSIRVRRYDELAKDASKLKKPLWELFDHYICMTSGLLNASNFNASNFNASNFNV